MVFDRSSLTRWRQRMGEQNLRAMLQESLAVATRTGPDNTLGGAGMRSRKAHQRGRRKLIARVLLPTAASQRPKDS